MRTGAKILLVCLTGLVVAGGALPSAAAHPDEHLHDEVADPNLRTLSLITIPTDHHGRPISSGGNNSSSPPKGGLGLSLNASETGASSREYGLRTGPGICVGYCVSSQSYVVEKVGLVGPDFEIQRDENYLGNAHFSYSWRGQVPSVVLAGGEVGMFSVEMLLGEEHYGTVSAPLRRGTSDVNLPLEFHHSEDCHGSREHHNRTQCQAGENETLPTYNATSITLRFTIYAYHNTLNDPMGGTLQFKLDTAGGTWLQVHEVPPPPPVEIQPIEENVTSAEAQELGVEVSDEDGDGEVDMDELHFVPAASPALLLAALGCLGFVLRRLRK